MNNFISFVMIFFQILLINDKKVYFGLSLSINYYTVLLSYLENILKLFCKNYSLKI